MRVTNNMKNNSLVNSMMKNQSLTGNLQAQLASGNKLNSASDNPSAIPSVMNANEMLNKISTYTDMEQLSAEEKTYFENTVKMLEGMIAGDTNAVNISDGGNARTIYRWYLQGLLNKTLAPAPKGMYDHFMVDYSVEENMNRFLDTLCPVQRTVEPNEELPVAVK